jgi:hypothetical protein
MGLAVGVAPDAHGEAGNDEVTAHGGIEGERPQCHHARTGSSHGVVAGDGGQDVRGVGRIQQHGGAPADQGQTGSVEEHGRTAVELQGVGSVFQRHRPRMEVHVGHGRAVSRSGWQ